MYVQDSQWMDKGPWYNTTICKKINGQSFKDYLETGRKYRCEFMCSVNFCDKDYVSIPGD